MVVMSTFEAYPVLVEPTIFPNYISIPQAVIVDSGPLFAREQTQK